VCALILAAGAGTRLRPLTAVTPKALCPVGNVALLDRALARLAHHGLAGPAVVAVNACHLAGQVSAHVGGRAYVRVEPGPTALGTAGAVANLRDWIAGRALLVGNADAYLAPDPPLADDLAPLFDGWDGTTVRLLCVAAGATRPAEFGSVRFAGFSLLPAAVAAAVPPGPGELVGAVWRPAERAGRLRTVAYHGTYLDTGTPRDLLAANLHAAGPGSLVSVDAVVTGSVEHSVVGAGARVDGVVRRGLVFPGGFVAPDERLSDCIRMGADVTVPAH
jgi:NDP-sugar pyrophosphorylase family protein